MLRKYSFYLGIPIATATLLLGSLAYAGPSANLSTTAGAERVFGTSTQTSSGESVLNEQTGSTVSLSGAQTVAGAAQVVQTAGEIDLSEIEEIDFWGYTNLGIAKVDNHLNIREEANENGKLVGKMSNDAACEILSLDGNWAYIKSGKVEGYVCTDFLLMGIDAVKRAEEIVAPMAVVQTNGLNVREQPDLNSEVITVIPEGEELEVAQVLDGGWVEVYLDDTEVYVSADYVTIEERLTTAITMTELLYGEGVSDVRVDLCQYAKQFVGNPYVWGGTSLTKGADCSGFVMSVFAHYGVTLPHSSSGQSGYGTKVSMNELVAGDIVFYGSGSRINHVAIYIGGGQVVHASSAKTGIKISSLYYRSPITARSILAK